ncbi:MAG: hypothetical protein R3B48_18605 [Kofleriaceae bacterium]
MSRAWYELALASASASPSVRLVASQSEHLGAAIAAALKAYPHTTVVAAGLSAGAPLGDSVGRSRSVVEQGPAPELPPATFRWPAGVVPALTSLEGLVGAAPGYVVHREEGPMVVIEAQVQADAIEDVFLGWVERLPVADNLEVRVAHDFDGPDADASTEVWLTPRIGVKQVLRFLDAHDRELTDNGHVELAIYLRQERSTLRLTEHKTLLWTSLDPETERRVGETLASLGVRQVSSLTKISSVAHFHTRSASSKDRAALTRYLGKQRMRVVDRLDRQGRSRSRPTP